MMQITLDDTPDTENEQHIGIPVTFLAELLAARSELKALKTQVDPVQITLTQMVAEHPDLIDYSGMSVSQAATAYPELFDYEVQERDC